MAANPRSRLLAAILGSLLTAIVLGRETEALFPAETSGLAVLGPLSPTCPAILPPLPPRSFSP